MTKKEQREVVQMLNQLNDLHSELMEIAAEERARYEKLSEKAQGGEHSVSFGNSADQLEEAVTHLESALECLSEIFYGVAMVACADSDPVRKAWELGINPGAQREDCSVTFQPLSPAGFQVFGAYLGQLITEQEAVLKLANLFH
jgi:hypothetical protein